MLRLPSQPKALWSAPLQLTQVPLVANVSAAACASQGPALSCSHPGRLQGLFLLPITRLSWRPRTAQCRMEAKKNPTSPCPKVPVTQTISHDNPREPGAVPFTGLCQGHKSVSLGLQEGSPSSCRWGLDTLGAGEEKGPPLLPYLRLPTSGLPATFEKPDSSWEQPAAGKRHRFVPPSMMLHHAALSKPTQCIMFYYTLK